MADNATMGGILAVLIASAAFSAEPVPLPKEQKAALASLSEDIEYAQHNLPPCEAIDRISSAALKYEPAKSCPKSQSFHDSIRKIDESFRSTCQEMSRWLSEELRNPEICANSEAMEKAKKRLQMFRRLPQAALDLQSLPEFDTDGATGEMSNPTCRFSVLVGMQLRKKLLSFSNSHFGYAEMGLANACYVDARYFGIYEQYLRGGEQAMKGKYD